MKYENRLKYVRPRTEVLPCTTAFTLLTGSAQPTPDPLQDLLDGPGSGGQLGEGEIFD